MSDNDLSPCPSCGSDNALLSRGCASAPYHNRWFVECLECGQDGGYGIDANEATRLLDGMQREEE